MTPINNAEIPGYIYIFLIILYSNISGIGGGYITIIVLYELFGFEYRKVLGYSAAINMVAALVRFAYYYKRKHPDKPHMTLIDYEMVMIMLPLGILGYMVGDVAFGILPIFVIAIITAVLWSGIAIEMLVKGYRRWRDESTMKK